MKPILTRSLWLLIAIAIVLPVAQAQEAQAAEEFMQFLKVATATWAVEKVLDKAKSIAFPTTSAEQDFNHGIALQHGGNHQQAMDAFRQSAEKGYAPAQNIMGDAARDSGNYADALSWYDKSAAQKDIHGLYQAAAIYWNGAVGVPHDYGRALDYLKTAADLGDRDAQSQFGSFVYLGDHIQKNPVQAAHYFELAAKQGDAMAEQAYGLCFAIGDACPQDFKAAQFWFRQAADQGEPMAEYNVGAMFQNGDAGTVDYCQARYWFRKAAAQGNSMATEALTKTSQPPSCQY